MSPAYASLGDSQGLIIVNHQACDVMQAILRLKPFVEDPDNVHAAIHGLVESMGDEKFVLNLLDVCKFEPDDGYPNERAVNTLMLHWNRNTSLGPRYA